MIILSYLPWFKCSPHCNFWFKIIPLTILKITVLLTKTVYIVISSKSGTKLGRNVTLVVFNISYNFCLLRNSRWLLGQLCFLIVWMLLYPLLRNLMSDGNHTLQGMNVPYIAPCCPHEKFVCFLVRNPRWPDHSKI